MARRSLFLIPLPLLLGLVALPAYAETAELLEQARTAFEQRDFRTTERLLRELAETSPTGEADDLLVRTLLLDHQVDDARKAAGLALNQRPEHPLVWVATGDVAYRESRFDDAETAYQRAIELDPETARAHLGLGRLAESERRLRSARDRYQRAHTLDPEDANVLEAMSRVPGESADVLRYLDGYLERATWEDPEVLEASAQRARLLRSLGDRGRCRRTLAQPKDTESGGKPATIELKEGNPTPQSAARFARVEVNLAKPIRALFDTGAPGLLLLSRRSANKAKVELISDGSIQGVGRGGQREIEYGLVEKVRIGPVLWEDCVVTIARGEVASGAGAVVGLSGFADLVITLDHRHDELRLRASAPELDDLWSWDRPDEVPEGFVTTRWIGGSYRVPVRVGGEGAPPLVLDTGAAITLLALDLARTAAPTRPVRDIARGLSGAQELHSVIGARLAIGDLTIRAPTVWASDLDHLDSWVGVRTGGFLGYDLLRRWTVVLDLRNGWLRLEEPD